MSLALNNPMVNVDDIFDVKKETLANIQRIKIMNENSELIAKNTARKQLEATLISEIQQVKVLIGDAIKRGESKLECIFGNHIYSACSTKKWFKNEPSELDIVPNIKEYFSQLGYKVEYSRVLQFFILTGRYYRWDLKISWQE